MLSGMLPLNWLPDRSTYLIKQRQQPTLHCFNSDTMHPALAGINHMCTYNTTYPNDVRLPMLSGMLPANWLPDRSRCLITGR